MLKNGLNGQETTGLEATKKKSLGAKRKELKMRVWGLGLWTAEVA
ncbi:hypothetical protein HHE06_07460 [Helicobacter heilmannii]|nr:hypothetical protein HHE06_07460 [Helicobacter heilmannii]